ncbi:hypothetical protein [Sorangium sp. So ce233]|uniref:hypothetical protein n=1 Tax=Sorangium sp. So ce233 TaxID=3133290 RepID=UPI003F60B952
MEFASVAVLTASSMRPRPSSAREEREGLDAERRRARRERHRGARLALGGIQIAEGDAGPDEVAASKQLRTHEARLPARRGGRLGERPRLGGLTSKHEDLREVGLRGERRLMQVHPFGLLQGHAHHRLRFLEVSELRADGAQVEACGAGVAAITGLVESTARGFHPFCASDQIACTDGMASARLVELRDRPHVPHIGVRERALDGLDERAPLCIATDHGQHRRADGEARELDALRVGRGDGARRQGRPALELVELAHLGRRDDHLRDGREPRGRAALEPLDRLHASLQGQGELAPPHMGLRLDQAEPARGVSGGTAADAALGPRDRRGEIAAPERLLGRAQVRVRRSRRRAADLEVLGQRHGVGAPGALQPFARERVPDAAIALREHAVGGLPHEGVPEPVLHLPRDARLVPPEDDLPPHELGEPPCHRRAAHEGRDAALPELRSF